MKNNIKIFLIVFSIIASSFVANIFAQNGLATAKLQKAEFNRLDSLLPETTIVSYTINYSAVNYSTTTGGFGTGVAGTAINNQTFTLPSGNWELIDVTNMTETLNYTSFSLFLFRSAPSISVNIAFVPLVKDVNNCSYGTALASPVLAYSSSGTPSIYRPSTATTNLTRPILSGTIYIAHVFGTASGLISAGKCVVRMCYKKISN